jgi:hypothetical protein
MFAHWTSLFIANILAWGQDQLLAVPLEFFDI